VNLYNKKVVRYTDDHGSSNEQCSKCKYFEHPRSCEIVIGAIKPGGWCNKYKKSAATEREDRLEGQPM
jgi:hypothetical protein